METAPMVLTLVFEREATAGSSEPELDQVDLSFAEECLGLPAEYGFGFARLDFGQRVGPLDRYEIVRKLGWGMQGSVWLARDHDDARYVAIKALTGNATALWKDKRTDERGVMEHVGKGIKLAGRPSYCASLLSHFIHPGRVPSDGQHLCLVMDVLAGDVAALQAGRHNLPPRLAKLVLRDVLRGLSQMHAAGCAHTDFKPANILCNVPGLTTEEILRANIASTPALRHAPEQSVNGFVEAAISQPIPAPTIEEALTGSFALADFGSAQFDDDHTTAHVSVRPFRAPEVIMQRAWDHTIDIWSFGCLVYQLLVGAYLFPPREDSMEPDEADRHHLARMCAFTGDALPVDFTALPADVRDAHPPAHFSSLFKERAAALGVSAHDNAGANELMMRCLRIDPTVRPTAVELLQHSEWLAELELGGESWPALPTRRKHRLTVTFEGESEIYNHRGVVIGHKEGDGAC
ncbi:kinase-like domain-containing protein [Mycena filopes]|nr:kinase-like domain-containing protein [Mycena filopes]